MALATSSLRPLTVGFLALTIASVGMVACSDTDSRQSDSPLPATEPVAVEHSAQPAVSAEAISRTGLYVYYADAALFTDCGSGERFPVASNAGGLELERAYLQSSREPLQPLLVEVIGAVESLPGMEEGTILPHFVADQLIRVSDADHCPSTNTRLTDTEWQLSSLAGEPVKITEGSRTPHLTFSEQGAVYGHTGCNNLRGSYQQQQGNLSLSGVAMTQKACQHQGDLEARFNDALNNTSAFHVEGDRLTLLNEAGTALAEFLAHATTSDQ